MMIKLDDMIDEMFLIRERKRELTKQLKAIEKESDLLQANLLIKMKEVGTDYARGKLASATITEQEVPTIDDWGKVSEWISENDAIYLLHRKVSSGAWTELRNAGTEIPGIEPFIKRTISLKTTG